MSLVTLFHLFFRRQKAEIFSVRWPYLRTLLGQKSLVSWSGLCRTSVDNLVTALPDSWDPKLGLPYITVMHRERGTLYDTVRNSSHALRGNNLVVVFFSSALKPFWKFYSYQAHYHPRGRHLLHNEGRNKGWPLHDGTERVKGSELRH